MLITAGILTTNFSDLFSQIKTGSPGRFLETVPRVDSTLTKGVWTGVTKRELPEVILDTEDIEYIK